MPYDVVSRDGKYCVVKEGGSKTFGCHETRDQANKQMSALYAAEKSLQEAGLKDHSYGLGYINQIGQDEAQYNPTGGSQESSCANCNWFISPDQCSIVAGVVSPTGISNLWRKAQEYSPAPIPVVIVEEKDYDKEEDKKKKKKRMESKSLFSYVKELFKSSGQQAQPPVQPAVSFTNVQVKADDGTIEDRIRFMLWGTNNFIDKHKEILSEEAHKEFVSWCDEKSLYPELWLWHTAGSRVGQVDWMDYSDGFLISSGLIDVGKEPIIENIISQNKEVGSSHGFVYTAKDNVVRQYRSWEFSLLPLEAAANSWTSFSVITKEAEVAFSDRKTKWLIDVAGVSEAQVKDWEQQTASLSEKLKALGIEYKEEQEEEPSEEGKVDLAPLVSSMMQLQATVEGLVTTFDASQKDFAKEIEALKKSDDEKIAAAIKNEIANLPKGFQASKEGEAPDDESNQQNKDDLNWFGETVIGSLTNAAKER